jgi:hypothetical protein
VIRAAAAAALALAAACGSAPAAQPRPEPPATRVARLPSRSELVCFPCHSHLKFEKGPPFAHGSAAHRQVGHCHVCHQGTGHEPREIDRGACLACHEAGSEPLGILAADDGKRD